jgi:hypothetical protein
VLSPATTITLIVFGVLGAVFGWRRGTKAIYRRSLREPVLAPGETKRDYERRLRRRRKLWRLVTTLVYFLLAAGIGLVFIAMTAR